MDSRTGAIYDYDGIPQHAKGHTVEMVTPPTQRQLNEGRVRYGDPCPCNSGKKFKNCCFLRSERTKKSLRKALSDSEARVKELEDELNRLKQS